MRAMLIGVLIGSLVMGTASAQAASHPPHKPLRYILLMSGNDAICKPLVAVYNHLLTKWEAKPYGYHEWVGNVPPMTDFEVTNPKAFAAAGLYPPTPLANSPYNERIYPIYHLDIFGDGEHRLVTQHDVWFGNWARDTEILVFKKGIELDGITLPKGQNKITAEIDPSFLDGNADIRYLASYQKKIYNINRIQSYMLTKWPNFKELFKINRRKINSFLPYTGGAGAIRIFLDRNKNVYSIYNEARGYPPVGIDTQVLVYTIKNYVPDDICYISLTSYSKKYIMTHNIQ